MKLAHLTFGVLLLASTSLSAASITKDATKLPQTDQILAKFAKQEFPDPKMSIISDAVSTATDYHNAIPFVTAKYSGTMNYLRGVEDMEHMAALKKADDACNINILSTYFSDASNVWGKLIEWGFAEEKATAGENVRKPTKVFIDESGMITMYENNRWEIGYEALMSLYQEPSKWGNQINPFPLWNDQKFVYDLYWAKKYGDMYLAVVSRCEASRPADSTDTSYSCDMPNLSKGPNLKDINDRYSREKKSRDNVLKAHNDYVRQIQVALGTSAAAGNAGTAATTAAQALNIDFSDPALPPIALPPFKEILVSNFWTTPPANTPRNVASAELTFYPAIPAPWRTVLELQYPSYFPETAKTYVGAFPSDTSSEIRQVMGASLVRDDATTKRYNLDIYSAIFDPTGARRLYRASSLTPDDSKLPFQLNRVAVAMDISTRLDVLRANYDTNPDGRQTIVERTAMERFKSDMARLGFTLSDDFDITNVADRAALTTQIRGVQDELIVALQKMLTDFKKDPKLRETHKKRIASIEALIKAFNTDSENTVFLSLQNAGKVDQAMKQAIADREALAQYQEAIENRNKDVVLQCPIR